MMQKKWIGNALIYTICLALIILCILLYYESNARLSVTHYKVTANLTKPVRIVQLTDLHNKIYGKSNQNLITAVREERPDIIVMTGDMLNQDDSDTEIVTDLINKLTPIAPIYFGYGNHEIGWEDIHNAELATIIAEAGAVVVNNTYEDVEIKGQELRIGGYMGYYRLPGMTRRDDNQMQKEMDFFNEFEATERLKLLLNHIPTSWLDWEYRNKASVDFVFSGHYHGGQIVLPFIGPLYAPYVGFKPPYTKGVFIGEKATCILSAGLGNEYWWLPRINNPPEIVVVDIIPID